MFIFLEILSHISIPAATKEIAIKLFYFYMTKHKSQYDGKLLMLAEMRRSQI